MPKSQAGHSVRSQNKNESRIIKDEQNQDGRSTQVSLTGERVNRIPDQRSRRIRDYTPTAMRDEYGSGGGLQFLAWIKDELLSWLETERRLCGSERALVGHSLYELFSLYSLFNDTRLFSAC